MKFTIATAVHEIVSTRLADCTNLQHGTPVQSASERLHATRRGQARVIALALLLGFCNAAAADGLTIGGSGAALGTMRLLAKEFTARNPDIAVTIVPNLGSGGGIRAVLGGAIGLAVTSRALEESEKKLGAVETEYARTPFVFAVSTQSRVTAVTARELADIYAGKMVAWADGSPVRVVLRPVNEIDTKIVENISADIRRAVVAANARPGVRVALSDQDAANHIEKIPGAIGPSSLALIVSENRALRALKLDGIEPTALNAAAGTYPYYKSLFLVTGTKRSATVALFIAFVQSAEGRKIITNNGQWIP